ncbi:MAG TPA: hypothetical protein VMI35_09590 [Puia sp.]|nr:hypothetical protein [Puia sp.]
MKKSIPVFFSVVMLVMTFAAHSQDLNNPGTYMDAITNAKLEMDQKYMAYMSVAAHRHSAKKVEKVRQQTLESIANSRSKTVQLPKYKGDNSLRQSSIDYIQFCYRIFNDDYSKIVNMEEIAEQSVDEMQAFILLQEMTSQKLKEAAAKMTQAEKDFAAKYNVNLVETKDELAKKLETAGRINHYCDEIFIVFFKCNWEDGEMTKAFNNKKLNDAEQARNALIHFTEEGMAKLRSDSLRSFEGNPALANSCMQALQFYDHLAKVDAPKMTDFFLKEENFDKIKKNMDAKGDSRTKADVDAYNKAVKDVNASANQFNQLNQDINKRRSEVNSDWEKAEWSFKNEMMPHYK